MNKSDKLDSAHLLRTYIEKGDRHSLSQFIKIQSEMLYRIAFRFLHNQADAEDILQMAFVTIIKKANDIKKENLHIEKAINSWCMTIVVNLCRKKLREEKRRAEREETIGSQRFEAKQQNQKKEKQTMDEKLSGYLEGAMELLPYKYRLPIYLRYIEKMGLDEISHVLTEKPGTIRVQLKRGLDKLSTILKSKGVVASGILLTGYLGEVPLQAAPKVSADVIDSIAKEISRPSSRLSQRRRKALPSNAGLSLFSAPVLLSFLGVLTIILAFLFFKNDSEDRTNIFEEHELPETVNKDLQTNYRSWDFSKPNITDVKIYRNSLKYHADKKAYKGDFNEVSVTVLNESFRDKIFYIECEVITLEKLPKKDVNVLFRFCWLHDNTLYGLKLYEVFHYNLPLDKMVSCKVYFHKNFQVNMLNNKIVEIIEFDKNIYKDKITLLSKNVYIRKIQLKHLKKVPAKIIDAINLRENIKKRSAFTSVSIDTTLVVTPD